ncbi:MAG: KpsF/GutQ family sugar-phosphate isomerase [Gemmatimonadota bacterium]
MTSGESDREAILRAARRVIELEARSVQGLVERLDDDFATACRLVAEASGRILVAGIGKSGIIGRKIAATLTSTGTPATFLHPVESLHGDLGLVGPDDVAILLSKSGETSELTGLVEYLGRVGVPIVAMTGRANSSLGRYARVVLDCSVDEEACPMDLAPTSSTTATLAMGDALAVVVLQMKGFRPEDFARIHPGGSLGRKLTLRVEDAMVGEGYPSLGTDAPMRETIVPIAEMRGTVPVVDDQDRVVGVVTAGDLTRLMEKDPDWDERSVGDVMTRTPRTARVGELASAVVRIMEEAGIMAVPVVDEDGVLRGVAHLHDLMRAGAV